MSILPFARGSFENMKRDTPKKQGCHHNAHKTHFWSEKLVTDFLEGWCARPFW